MNHLFHLGCDSMCTVHFISLFNGGVSAQFVSTCNARIWGRRHSPGILSLVRSYPVWSRMMRGRHDRASSYNGTELSSEFPAVQHKRWKMIKCWQSSTTSDCGTFPYFMPFSGILRTHCVVIQNECFRENVLHTKQGRQPDKLFLCIMKRKNNGTNLFYTPEIDHCHSDISYYNTYFTLVD